MKELNRELNLRLLKLIRDRVKNDSNSEFYEQYYNLTLVIDALDSNCSDEEIIEVAGRLRVLIIVN